MSDFLICSKCGKTIDMECDEYHAYTDGTNLCRECDEELQRRWLWLPSSVGFDRRY